jgi:hypothetical protein
MALRALVIAPGRGRVGGDRIARSRERRSAGNDHGSRSPWAEQPSQAG